MFVGDISRGKQCPDTACARSPFYLQTIFVHSDMMNSVSRFVSIKIGLDMELHANDSYQHSELLRIPIIAMLSISCDNVPLIKHLLIISHFSTKLELVRCNTNTLSFLSFHIEGKYLIKTIPHSHKNSCEQLNQGTPR